MVPFYIYPLPFILPSGFSLSFPYFTPFYLHGFPPHLVFLITYANYSPHRLLNYIVTPEESHHYVQELLGLVENLIVPAKDKRPAYISRGYYGQMLRGIVVRRGSPSLT